VRGFHHQLHHHGLRRPGRSWSCACCSTRSPVAVVLAARDTAARPGQAAARGGRTWPVL